MELKSEETKELVDRIVEAAHPKRIILFGSAARGDAGPNSDVDVLVVMSDGSHRLKTAQQIYRRLVGFALPVDIVVATDEDLKLYRDSECLVYSQALRNGKELYVG
jgi:predicted nucleotidyltransferase